MKRVLNKKSVILYVLTAVLVLSLSLFALSVNKTKMVSANENKNYYLMDADQLSFDGQTTTAKADDNNLFGTGIDNNILQTTLTKANPSIKVIASGYGEQIYGGDNDITKVEVKLLYNRWGDYGYGGFSEDATYAALRIYNSADTKFENPIASVEDFDTMGNFIRTLQLSPEQVCNNRGKLQSFVLRVESDASSWASALIIDYVKVVFEGSGITEAGYCTTSKNPENITDANVVWTEAKNYCDTYIDFNNYGGFYSYVDNPAMVELRAERFPNVACVAEADGTETLLLKNAVFALNVGNLSVDGYQQFVMDILLADKRALGGHTLYLYGSNPDRFVDADGEPVGYVAKVSVENNEQGFHNQFILEGEDVRKLAGEDGIVSNIYVLYHGNTLDTAQETVGLRNGSQIWINKVQFLAESQVEEPIVVNQYDKYDISDIFPVGESVSVNNKAVGTSGDIVANALLTNQKVDELSFTLSMESTANVAFLFNAKGREQINEYSNGGILFYLSNSEITISANMGGEATKSISAAYQKGFDKKLVKIECIPYTLTTVEAGFYCSVWVGGEKVLGDYFRNDCLALGDNFMLCYEAKDSDFSINLGSSKTENITSGQDLMKVNIKAETLKHSFDKTDIPLALSWFYTGFDEISEITCDGTVATINQDSRHLQFNVNGEVTVYFSITNAFGTFKSNALTVVCEDVVEMPQIAEPQPVVEESCSSTVDMLPMALMGIVFVVFFVVKNTKWAKDGE